MDVIHDDEVHDDIFTINQWLLTEYVLLKCEHDEQYVIMVVAQYSAQMWFCDEENDEIRVWHDEHDEVVVVVVAIVLDEAERSSNE